MPSRLTLLGWILLPSLWGQQAPLPTGLRIDPAGRSYPLDTFPVRALPLPDNRVLVLHSGYRPPSLAILNLTSGAIEKTLTLPDAAHSLVIHNNAIYVPGGHASAVFVTDLALSALKTFPIEWPNREFPRSFAADAAVSPDGRTLWVAEQMQNSVAVLDAHTGQLLRRFAAGSHPVRILLNGTRLLVASAGDHRVLALNPTTGEQFAASEVASRPADLFLAANRLFVAGSGSSFVDVLDPQTLRPQQRLNLAPRTDAPFLVSPSHFAAANGRLFVACPDANAIAVLDLAPSLKVSGFIPAGWYPTATAVLPDSRLLILNGKGNGSRPNPNGPNPSRDRQMTPQPPSAIEYLPLIQTGSAQLVQVPSDLRALTRRAARLIPPSQIPPAARSPKHPIPARRNDPSPIRHVILIMKENRTYDQVLGDLPQGNGDPSLCLFPERITPNHHALARQFALFDNFYVNADVSSEGWLWTSAAIVPHLTMRSWPAAYAGRSRPQGATSDAAQPARYLWTAALQRGLSVRNYGFFVSNRPGARPGQDLVAKVADPAIEPYTNRFYAGYDPDFPDVERAAIFLRDLDEFSRTGQMPALTVMVLPNDHTFGTSPGKLSPFSSVADNDLALGRIVEGVSQSPFWPRTAIFVVEDDAQNGPDHVDSHRAPAFVISPFIRRGFVDHRFYNTTSVLRTIERILSLPPMTHYDATAPLFLAPFQDQPDLTTYTARPANVPLTDLNPPRPPKPAEAAWDWSRPDQIDDAALNDALWLALRGTPAPPPTQSLFVRLP